MVKISMLMIEIVNLRFEDFRKMFMIEVRMILKRFMIRNEFMFERLCFVV